MMLPCWTNEYKARREHCFLHPPQVCIKAPSKPALEVVGSGGSGQTPHSTVPRPGTVRTACSCQEQGKTDKGGTEDGGTILSPSG